MRPHVHVGMVEAVTVICYVLIFSLLWKALAAALAERGPALSSAMLALYS